MTMKRKIIEIDRKLCDGCGQCTTACAEGALELDGEGKAVLVRDIYCDGLGACLDVCPTGALKVVEKDASAYDEDATASHVEATRGREAVAGVHRTGRVIASPAARPGPARHSGCPGSMARSFTPTGGAPSPRGQVPAAAAPSSRAPSELGHWPIQLHLVSPAAPYFRECDLLVAADCTAFALGSFHQDLLRGKALVIACPKLDRVEGYVEKLAELIASNTVYSITVAIMEVPCCSGLRRIVEEAIERSGKSIAARIVVVGMDGQRR
jgi:NAD-dependent dihydropyrimidine dehydrogenase PreA subunit